MPFNSWPDSGEDLVDRCFKAVQALPEEEREEFLCKASGGMTEEECDARLTELEQEGWRGIKKRLRHRVVKVLEFFRG